MTTLRLWDGSTHTFQLISLDLVIELTQNYENSSMKTMSSKHPEEKIRNKVVASCTAIVVRSSGYSHSDKKKNDNEGKD